MDTSERLRKIASEELGIDASTLAPNDTLASLSKDSLDFIDFLFKIEDEFGISVPDEALKTITTVADLERYITSVLETNDQGA
jgi:acyl carrier protein